MTSAMSPEVIVIPPTCRRSARDPYFLKLGKIIKHCLVDVVQDQPADPFIYIAKWLYHYSDTRQYFHEKRKLEAALQKSKKEEEKKDRHRRRRLSMLRIEIDNCEDLLTVPLEFIHDIELHNFGLDVEVPMDDGSFTTVTSTPTEQPPSETGLERRGNKGSGIMYPWQSMTALTKFKKKSLERVGYKKVPEISVTERYEPRDIRNVHNPMMAWRSITAVAKFMTVVRSKKPDRFGLEVPGTYSERHGHHSSDKRSLAGSHGTYDSRSLALSSHGEYDNPSVAASSGGSAAVRREKEKKKKEKTEKNWKGVKTVIHATNNLKAVKGRSTRVQTMLDAKRYSSLKKDQRIQLEQAKLIAAAEMRANVDTSSRSVSDQSHPSDTDSADDGSKSDDGGDSDDFATKLNKSADGGFEGQQASDAFGFPPARYKHEYSLSSLSSIDKGSSKSGSRTSMGEQSLRKSTNKMGFHIPSTTRQNLGRKRRGSSVSGQDPSTSKGMPSKSKKNLSVGKEEPNSTSRQKPSLSGEEPSTSKGDSQHDDKDSQQSQWLRELEERERYLLENETDEAPAHISGKTFAEVGRAIQFTSYLGSLIEPTKRKKRSDASSMTGSSRPSASSERLDRAIDEDKEVPDRLDTVGDEDYEVPVFSEQGRPEEEEDTDEESDHEFPSFSNLARTSAKAATAQDMRQGSTSTSHIRGSIASVGKPPSKIENLENHVSESSSSESSESQQPSQVQQLDFFGRPISADTDSRRPISADTDSNFLSDLDLSSTCSDVTEMSDKEEHGDDAAFKSGKKSKIIKRKTAAKLSGLNEGRRSSFNSGPRSSFKSGPRSPFKPGSQKGFGAVKKAVMGKIKAVKITEKIIKAMRPKGKKKRKDSQDIDSNQESDGGFEYSSEELSSEERPDRDHGKIFDASTVNDRDRIRDSKIKQKVASVSDLQDVTNIKAGVDMLSKKKGKKSAKAISGANDLQKDAETTETKAISSVKSLQKHTKTSENKALSSVEDLQKGTRTSKTKAISSVKEDPQDGARSTDNINKDFSLEDISLKRITSSSKKKDRKGSQGKNTRNSKDSQGKNSRDNKGSQGKNSRDSKGSQGKYPSRRSQSKKSLSATSLPSSLDSSDEDEYNKGGRGPSRSSSGQDYKDGKSKGRSSQSLSRKSLVQYNKDGKRMISSSMSLSKMSASKDTLMDSRFDNKDEERKASSKWDDEKDGKSMASSRMSKVEDEKDGESMASSRRSKLEDEKDGESMASSRRSKLEDEKDGESMASSRRSKLEDEKDGESMASSRRSMLENEKDGERKALPRKSILEDEKDGERESLSKLPRSRAASKYDKAGARNNVSKTSRSKMSQSKMAQSKIKIKGGQGMDAVSRSLLQPNLARWKLRRARLVCVHPVLGTMGASFKPRRREIPEIWDATCYHLHDQEIYNLCDTGESMHNSETYLNRNDLNFLDSDQSIVDS